MIKFLQEDQGERNEIVIFCTEKNLLVDNSFLEISKELNPTERQNLLVFKKETSNKSNAQLKVHLSEKNSKKVCLCSFSYMIGGRSSNLLKDSYTHKYQ